MTRSIQFNQIWSTTTPRTHRSANRTTHFKYNFPTPLRSTKSGAQQPQEHIDPTYTHSYSARTEGEMNRSVPECHTRGSKAPSTCFQPGYRPGRCGSRCTPSWCRRDGGAAAGNGRRGKSSGSQREASTKTPSSAVLSLRFQTFPLGSVL